jgi:ribosomal protein L11 methyltransferase
MTRILVRLSFAIALTIGAIYLGSILFHHWQQIPRQDFDAWKIEYATINLDQGQKTELKLQVRVESTFKLKNNAIPHILINLSNLNDEIVATKLLSPQEWLPYDSIQDQQILLLGIKSGAEITSTIPIEVPENATGYSIRIIYPSPTLN